MTKPVYIVDALRTPVGKAPRGVFRNVRPDDLLAEVLRALMQKQPSVPLDAIEDVIIGCAMPEGEQGMNVARSALLLAGLPNRVPGMTINRFCSSGLQSIALAAQQIALGQADVMIAGGTESMSMVPMGGNKYSVNPQVFSHENTIAIAYSTGITAEIVAERYKIDKEAQLQFALLSHQRAVAAQKNGEFTAEILPISVTNLSADLNQHQIPAKNIVVNQDEGPRADTAIEKMAQLPPVFAKYGSVNAATSSQMSDGAACLLLVSETALQQYQLTPLAEWKSFSVAGVPPEIMGIGPVFAIPKALKIAGLSLDQIDWIELNEAFAAQSLAVIQESKLDPNKVNPLGGAIALGHPLGATGAIRATTLLHGLKRRNHRYGMVTMCIGTGMGAAGIFAAI